MAEELDLGFVLSIVRRALEGVGNFAYNDFMDSVLRRCAELRILPEPPDGHYHNLHLSLSRVNARLEQLVAEAFFYLLHNGFIVPCRMPRTCRR